MIKEIRLCNLVITSFNCSLFYSPIKYRIRVIFLIERQFLFSSTYCTIIFDRVASTKYRSISLVFRTQIACSIENVKCDVARTLNFFYTLFSTVHLDIYIYQNDHKCKVLIKNWLLFHENDEVEAAKQTILISSI